MFPGKVVHCLSHAAARNNINNNNNIVCCYNAHAKVLNE